MGQEIADNHFKKHDFDAFEERLRRETELLEKWFLDGTFSNSANKGGFELEAWLFENKNTFKKVLTGLSQVGSVKRGSFAKYVK